MVGDESFVLSEIIDSYFLFGYNRTNVPIEGVSIMYRGKRVSFHASKEAIDRLFACNRMSAYVWNACLEVAKNHHLQAGKWINRTHLQQAIKKMVPLHSQSIQAVAHNYLDARDSTKKAREKGISTARYPYKKKRHYNTKWVDKAFKIEGNKITLSMGAKRKPIVVFVSDLPSGDIKEIELCYDNGLYLSVSFDDGQLPEERVGTQEAGVDMGEIHSFASIAENGEGVILSGRKLRSIHRFRNQKLKELQRKMSKCKKGSNQWKKYQRAKKYILSKSDKQLRDASHKITRNFMEWAVEESVHTLHVGDARNVSKHTKKRKRLNRTNRQKMSNWNVGQLLGYLVYKAEATGIQVVLVDESYTTQTCPVCQNRRKPSGRTYTCSCGYEAHRDLHGAANILTKSKYKKMLPVPTSKKITYLRVA